MKVREIAMITAAVVLSVGQVALADGMIVPVRPELPVRGHWSVKYHHVKVLVRDQVASVHIDQAFVNDGKGDIEVEYLFPVPPGAAIKSMTMIVDGKEMTGKLMEAKKARQIYEDIVRRKKDPALLEYVGFGLYRTRAFPLQPGKPCKVIVTYETVCKKDHNLIEVFYPLNTEKFSSRKIEDVRVTVDIKAKADITAVYSPTHDLETKRKNPRHVIATWSVKNAIPDTDFLVYYKAADEDVGATLMTWQPDGDKDGYFMMLVSPNPRSAKKKIVPKDVVVVLDHSGSMSGKKIDQARDALRFVLRNLNDEDRFNIIVYNDTVESFFEKKLVEVTKKNRDEALDRIDRIEAGGSTNIHGALQAAMKSWPAVDGKPGPRPRYVIFLTDGLPTSGKKTDEKSILADTKNANGAGARIFAFGVGYDVNVRLLDNLVDQNHGRSDYVKPAENIEAKVSSLYAKIKNPVMTNLKMRIQKLKIRDTYPRELGDLFDGDQIVAVGRYDAKDMAKLAPAAGKDTACTLVITGLYEGKQRGFEYSVPIRGGDDKRFVFVERLWAVRRVGYLLDQIQLHGESKEIVDELINLSKTYGIMTPYTAFLADESVNLGRPADVSSMGRREAKKLSEATSGFRGQAGAKARLSMKTATRAPAPAGPAATPDSGVRQYGHARRRDYEADKAEYVEGVRNVGNQALYRRGKVWLAPGTENLDLKKDADKIKEIKRFSEKYFDLVRKNTIEENQVFAGQRAGEELLIRLRGQVYRIR